MTLTVTMPQMGESVVEGTIERWFVREGEPVEKDQILCEVSTDKVDAEIPAPETGVVERILVAEGETVEVGAGLALIRPGAVPGRVPTPEAPASPEPRSGVPGPGPQPRAPAPGTAEPGEASPEARVTPLARRIAEAEGVDLADVAEAHGQTRLTKEDLLAWVREGRTRREQPPGETPVTPTRETGTPPPGSLLEFLAGMRVPVYDPREGDRIVPFNAVRRRTAEHMVVSKIVSPHVGTVAEVDLHRVVRLREQAKHDFERTQGFKLTYLPFVVQATVRALRDFPRMNATVVGESVVERAGIHVGVAVETERGLVVPVIRDTDRLSLVGIARAIEDLAGRARRRQITADDLRGGTFTLTNPGREGNLFGLAVINQPQVGILRMGEVRKRPVVMSEDREDRIAIHPMMYLALSYDHRVIDGVTGNGFLHRVGRLLEDGDFEL